MRNEGIKELFAYWMYSDEILWRSYRKIYLWILKERLVKGHSYEKIAERSKLDQQRFRNLFEMVVRKIERTHSKKLADFIREIDKELDGIHVVSLN